MIQLVFLILFLYYLAWFSNRKKDMHVEVHIGKVFCCLVSPIRRERYRDLFSIVMTILAHVYLITLIIIVITNNSLIEKVKDTAIFLAIVIICGVITIEAFAYSKTKSGVEARNYQIAGILCALSFIILFAVFVAGILFKILSK